MAMPFVSDSDVFPDVVPQLREFSDLTALLFSDIYIHSSDYRCFIQNLKIPCISDDGREIYYHPPILSGVPESMMESVKELCALAKQARLTQGENWFPLFYKGEAKTASFRGQIVSYSSGEWFCLRRLDIPPRWANLGVHTGISNTLFNFLNPQFGREKFGHSIGGAGLILITGPMGEGKTTTFHSLAREATIRYGGVTVIIGNPVEFPMEGFYGRDNFGRIFQKNTDDKNFSEAFYENLRMNPRRLCFEEIRSTEAARAALEASRSGIAVMATMHATDPLQALNRFSTLAAGSDGYSRELAMKDISLALKAIVNQRLLPDAERGVRIRMNGLFVDPFDNALITAIDQNQSNQISSRYEDQQVMLRQGREPINFKPKQDLQNGGKTSFEGDENVDTSIYE